MSHLCWHLHDHTNYLLIKMIKRVVSSQPVYGIDSTTLEAFLETLSENFK